MYLKEYANKEKIIGLIDLLVAKGCTKENAASLITNNLFLIGYANEELNKKISIIYNGPMIYGVLFCNNNTYRWSLYNEETNTFSPFKGFSEEESIEYGNIKKHNEDYIIEMILDLLNNPKLKSFINVNNDMSLEEKINFLKNIDINKEGYRIK